MDTHEIEQLISEAISNRPTSTNAPMNLYIHRNRLICGARIVMPRDAAFVAHLTLHQFQKGFNDKEWKLLVEEIRRIAGTGTLTSYSDKRSANTESDCINHRAKPGKVNFAERRTELRLHHRSPVRFAGNNEKEFAHGKMRDVCSGGMSFSCRAASNYLQQGQVLTTHFDVPHFNADKSFDKMEFTRIGHIRRVDKVDPALFCVALQFAKPLPFKPAEDYFSEPDTQQNRETEIACKTV